MTLASMTGFARVEGGHAPYVWAWELKSVNGRGLDVRLRTPPGFDGLEAPVRERVRARFARGSVQLGLQLSRDPNAAASPPVRVNVPVLMSLIEQLQPAWVHSAAGELQVAALLSVKGVVETGEDEALDPDARAALLAAILASFEAGLDDLATARRQEGAALLAILTEALDAIAALAESARTLAATQPAALAARVQRQFDELLGEGRVDPERLAIEAAALAVKADVREELDRLDAHVEAARILLAAEGPVGRKLDFLAQEFMREANTLCSKSADSELTRLGLDLKARVDQMKEQVANVE